jgi:flagellar biosynthesis protein FlhG
MQDQAERLRQLVGKLNAVDNTEIPSAQVGNCRTVAITSGKGGVGKTNLSVNFGLALAKKGRRVLLMDADMGLANVDIMMGIIPAHSLADVLNGKKRLPEIILEGPFGLKLIASGSGGVQELAELNEIQRTRFLQDLLEMQNREDVILIDTGAGLHRNVLAFALAADEVIVVTTPEPTALMDAYGMIKTIYREKQKPQVSVVVNMASSPSEGDEAGRKLVVLSKRFLSLDINYLGSIPRDMGMVRAVKDQKPILLSSPMSPAAISISKIVDSYFSGKISSEEGNLTHFFKKVTLLFGGVNHSSG